MPDDDGRPFLGDTEEVRLRWKSRRRSGSKPGDAEDSGSFYTTLPKERVHKLGWPRQVRLEARFTDQGIVLRPRLPAALSPRRFSRTPRDRILHGDVLDQIRRLPDECVHLAMTSPPYNVGIEYSNYSDDRGYFAYREWLQQVWREVFRVLVRGGRFVLQTAPTSIAAFRPIHTDLTNDARDVGFQFRAEIIWYKQNMTARRTAWGSFGSPGHPHVIPSWEYVNVLAKGAAAPPWEYLNVLHKGGWKLSGAKADADIRPDEFVKWSDALWVIPPDTQRRGDHPATFPRELVERVLRFYSFRGQTILDPFGGTGTVAAVAKETGRHFIYIDQSETYCKLARARIQATTFGSDGRGHESEVRAPKPSVKRRA